MAASAAYQAGEAQGRALALRQNASPKKKAKKPVDPLLAQAQQIAQAETAAQIRAIRGQQAQINQQALSRAGQITDASQAAANLLQSYDLPGATSASYDQAAKTLGALAGNFSGQTQADAQAAIDAARAHLATLNAPAGGLKTPTGQTSDPEAMKNVLFGLGGFIPGNLLETTGQAQAAVQRGLPASTLAYGQQQAAGTLAAGQEKADTLTPDVLAAQGKLPELARSVYSSLLNAQDKAFGQKLALAKYNTGIDEFNTRTTLQYKQLDLSAQKFAQQTLNQDRNYKLALGRLGIAGKSLQLRVTAQEYKLQNGGFTKSQLNRFQTDAEFVAGQASTAKNRPSLADAMQQMYQRHVPLSIAQDALRKAGYSIPTDAQLKAYNQTVGVGATASPLDVVTFAKGYLGVPYVWGGNDPEKGLDCSAFVQQLYARVGIKLPRTTYAQVKAGRAVPLADIQPGDLIFTRPGKNGPNHVGIYIGNGQVQESPHTGDVNKVIGLSAYLSGGFVAARRILGG